jgi:hypothetical protein
MASAKNSRVKLVQAPTMSTQVSETFRRELDARSFADPPSGATNKRDADGEGEGLLDGTDASCFEAEV